MGRARTDWCRGKAAVSHLPLVALPSPGSVRCHAQEWWNHDGVVWSCWHILKCERCDKHLENVVRCPGLPTGLPQLGIDWPMASQSRYVAH